MEGTRQGDRSPGDLAVSSVDRRRTAATTRRQQVQGTAAVVGTAPPPLPRQTKRLQAFSRQPAMDSGMFSSWARLLLPSHVDAIGPTILSKPPE